MKKKARRFAEGGFSEEQEKWLGGADRTDPIILARMRAAVPDKVADKVSETVKNVAETEDTSKPKSVEKTMVRTKVSPVKEPVSDDIINPDVKIRPKSEALKQLREELSVSSMPKSFTASGGNNKATKSKGDLPSVRLSLPDPLAKYDNKNWSMKSGGSVKSSASSRGDGIAQRGKTRGKIC